MKTNLVMMIIRHEYKISTDTVVYEQMYPWKLIRFGGVRAV